MTQLHIYVFYNKKSDFANWLPVPPLTDVKCNNSKVLRWTVAQRTRW